MAAATSLTPVKWIAQSRLMWSSTLVDDLGYVQQNPDEAEVLFTLLAERYERHSVMVTSNLVFSPSSAVSGGIRRRPDPLFCWGNHRLRFPPTSRNHADFRSVGCHFGCQSSRGDALQIGAVCG